MATGWDEATNRALTVIEKRSDLRSAEMMRTLMAGGRPSKYKPEFCKQLVEHMATGMSYLSFAGVIGINEDTLFEWETKHVEFSESKKEAFGKNRVFWEKVGIDGIFAGKEDKQLNATLWIFNMKNRFRKEWTDTQKIESKIEISAKPEIPTGDQMLEAMANDPAFKNKVKK